jgi:AraC family transcriptional regulator
MRTGECDAKILDIVSTTSIDFCGSEPLPFADRRGVHRASPSAIRYANVIVRSVNLAPRGVAVWSSRMKPTKLSKSDARPTGTSDQRALRFALRGVLPEPEVSRRLSDPSPLVVELFRTRNVDVVAQCSYHTIAVITGDNCGMYQCRNGSELQATMCAGDVIVTPAGSPKLWQIESAIEYIAVRVPPSFLEKIVAAAGSEIRHLDLVDTFQAHDRHIEQLATRLLREATNECYGSRIYAEALATELGVHLLRNYCVATASAAEDDRGLPIHKLRQATDYIEANLRRDLTVLRISDAVAMSTGHFAHAFKATTGVTPHHFVLERRIERAKGLLRQSALPVAEVACRVGFPNQSYFSAAFRRATGVTPLRFRQGN